MDQHLPFESTWKIPISRQASGMKGHARQNTSVTRRDGRLRGKTLFGLLFDVLFLASFCNGSIHLTMYKDKIIPDGKIAYKILAVPAMCECRVTCVNDPSCTTFSIHRPTLDIADCFFSTSELEESNLMASDTTNTVFKFDNTTTEPTGNTSLFSSAADTSAATSETATAIATSTMAPNTGLFVSSNKSPDGTYANQNATCMADGGVPALLTTNALVEEVVQRFVPNMEFHGVWTTLRLQVWESVWPDGTRFLDTGVTYPIIPFTSGTCYRFSSLNTFQQQDCVSTESAGYVICTH
ncbi:uncharacterized protein LOC122245639 [Penaeus japonicus]|uniref:uncharacterized protein LOC122245639 n=1 Tax=Penaeus japonicus TaxID=27405 RepID=UPI001C715230|nr:uncharacterized protein LOC122245639 [Penaeus japonicus]